MGYINPSGVSFGSIQRSFLTPPNSHFRQGLNPAMPAQPVGPSPGFRAVACVCMVTSPNKVEVACRSLRTSCARLLLRYLYLIRMGWQICQGKRYKSKQLFGIWYRAIWQHPGSPLGRRADRAARSALAAVKPDGAGASRCTMSLCRRSADFSVSLSACSPRLAHRIRWLISMPTTRIRSESSVLSSRVDRRLVTPEAEALRGGMG